MRVSVSLLPHPWRGSLQALADDLLLISSFAGLGRKHFLFFYRKIIKERMGLGSLFGSKWRKYIHAKDVFCYNYFCSEFIQTLAVVGFLVVKKNIAKLITKFLRQSVVGQVASAIQTALLKFLWTANHEPKGDGEGSLSLTYPRKKRNKIYKINWI